MIRSQLDQVKAQLNREHVEELMGDLVDQLVTFNDQRVFNYLSEEGVEKYIHQRDESEKLIHQAGEIKIEEGMIESSLFHERSGAYRKKRELLIQGLKSLPVPVSELKVEEVLVQIEESLKESSEVERLKVTGELIGIFKKRGLHVGELERDSGFT